MVITSSKTLLCHCNTKSKISQLQIVQISLGIYIALTPTGRPAQNGGQALLMCNQITTTNAHNPKQTEEKTSEDRLTYIKVQIYNYCQVKQDEPINPNDKEATESIAAAEVLYQELDNFHKGHKA